MVSTDILLTGFGLVCCVASKPRIKQVHNDFSNRMNNYRFSKKVLVINFSLYLLGRSILKVIMYFIFYLCIQSGTIRSAYSRFTIYFVCLVSHIHQTQASVLKPR